MPADGIEGEGWGRPDIGLRMPGRQHKRQCLGFAHSKVYACGWRPPHWTREFDVGDGGSHVQIAHDDPNWTGARQRISGRVEVLLGNGNIGFTAGTNLDSDAIQAVAHYRGNHDDGTFRIGVNTSGPSFLGGNPTVSGEFTIRDDGSRAWRAAVFGSFNNDRGLQGGFRVLFGHRPRTAPTTGSATLASLYSRSDQFWTEPP